MKNNLEKKSSGLALLPFLIFVVIYLSAGLILQHQGVEMAFYQFPSVTAMFIALVVAFAMTKGNMSDRFKVFSKGAANEDVLTMLVIYLLAGAFSAVATAMGGRDATIDLGLHFIPLNYLTVGMFIISAFMGTATGSSMGTISAIIPIAVGVAVKGNLNVPLMIGACVGGAMFGDNLSLISDTTIAATRSQGCEMRDKFKVNLFIALPAAVITIIALLFLGKPEILPEIAITDLNVVKVLPYLLILILALSGMNVFIVLTIGIFTSAIVGFATGSFTVLDFAGSVWKGFTDMNEVFFLTLLCGGMSAMVSHNGGIKWLIEKLSKIMKGNKSAQLGIASLVSLADCATANNTVAIVVSGQISKDISKKYRVDPRRTASILDVFSCVFQGVIPYGAQLLSAASLSNANGYAISPTDIIPNIWYCWILAIFGLLSIFIPFADRIIKKNPWNWDYDCAESDIEKKRIAMAAEDAREL